MSTRLFSPPRRANLQIRRGLAPLATHHFGELTFPSTATWLNRGGDCRLTLNVQGRNPYGGSSVPDPELLSFGSSTASTISAAGFAAATRVQQRLSESSERLGVCYALEINRIRQELTQLCGLADLSPDIIFGASGTDLHLFAACLMSQPDLPPPLIVRIEAAETGRGVPDALAGCHFSDSTALQKQVAVRTPLENGPSSEVISIACRSELGVIRPLAEVDAEVEQATLRALSSSRQVLIILVDVSKTGLIAPSPDCVAALKARFPAQVEVLVDACQFRLAPASLRTYLAHDFLVAITGSKFVSGPIFSGALLVPPSAAKRLQSRSLPKALSAYSAQADWPDGWLAQAVLPPAANFGLLLRWEAALAELRAFRQLPEPAIGPLLARFGQALARYFAARSSSFLPLPMPVLARFSSEEKSWDTLPTIFPFLLRRRNTCLTGPETKRVQELLRENQLAGTSVEGLLARRGQLGQPVACGPTSALRLCLSSRLIVDALQGRGEAAVFADAMAVLDKAVLLTELL